MCYGLLLISWLPLESLLAVDSVLERSISSTLVCKARLVEPNLSIFRPKPQPLQACLVRVRESKPTRNPQTPQTLAPKTLHYLSSAMEKKSDIGAELWT